MATAPHQDAHSVFIVQVHGAKRWCVHRPPSAWTLKALQRGKNGDVISPDDDVAMGEAVLNVTLRPGDVLYIPRGYFHHTATSSAALSAEDVNGLPRAATPEQPPAEAGEPSMALTISVLSEDVFALWLYLLGEAVQAAAAERSRRARRPGRGGRARDAPRRRVLGLASRRSQACGQGGGEGRDGRGGRGGRGGGGGGIGSRLRECAACPRAICAVGASRSAFTQRDARRHGGSARSSSVGRRQIGSDGCTLPKWLRSTEPRAPLLALDAALERKRIPCTRLGQIGPCWLRSRGSCRSRAPMTPAVDVDGIFLMEKRDKSYVPEDRCLPRAGRGASKFYVGMAEPRHRAGSGAGYRHARIVTSRALDGRAAARLSCGGERHAPMRCGAPAPAAG